MGEGFSKAFVKRGVVGLVRNWWKASQEETLLRQVGNGEGFLVCWRAWAKLLCCSIWVPVFFLFPLVFAVLEGQWFFSFVSAILCSPELGRGKPLKSPLFVTWKKGILLSCYLSWCFYCSTIPLLQHVCCVCVLGRDAYLVDGCWKTREVMVLPLSVCFLVASSVFLLAGAHLSLLHKVAMSPSMVIIYLRKILADTQ